MNQIDEKQFMKKILIKLFFLSIFSITVKANVLPPLHINGEYISIDHARIWIERYGKGTPPVILINGAGDNIQQAWGKVLPRIIKITQIIAYDRQGLGKSNPSLNITTPRTAKKVVIQLRRVLQKAHINPPYILVAHSLGGLYLQYFARNYPHEVAGIVMVDGNIVPGVLLKQIHGLTSIRQKRRIPKLIYEQDQEDQRTLQKLLTLKKNIHNKPTVAQSALIEYYLENLGKKISAKQVANSPPLPNVPMAVLVSRKDPIWHLIQKQFALSVSNSIYCVYPNSGHYIQRDDPKAVISAIQWVVKQTRFQHGEVQTNVLQHLRNGKNCIIFKR